MTGTMNNTGDFDAQAIVSAMGQPLEAGQTWYLVSKGWFQEFMKHYNVQVFGIDSDGVSSSDDGAQPPGPIDNRPLLDENGRLKRGLLDNTNYVSVPSEAWESLSKKFGVVDKETSTLPRTVIEDGEFIRQKRIEVYPPRLNLYLYDKRDDAMEDEFSVQDTLGTVKRRALKAALLPPDTDVKLWLKNGPDFTQWKYLQNMEETLQLSGLGDGDEIIVEVRKFGEPWQSRSEESNRIVSPRPSYQPGICGLQNLGNTCFMNSILQCMSNTPQVTSYFLNKKHLDELNTENPLGTRGELAKSFGELLAEMWSGNHSSVVPRNFKTQVSRFAPQFSGCLQHDAHELLIFLLDGLHEDLNRIREKPYIELKEADGRPDIVVAKEAWDNYLKRNDSIMVNIFHGMLKSTVVCLECDKVSVTFDPNPPWALPLPFRRERNINVVHVPKDPKTKPCEYRVSIARDGTLAEFADIIACNLPDVEDGSHLKIAFISSGYPTTFPKFFSPSDKVSDVGERERLYAYDMGSPVDSSKLIVPVKFRRQEGDRDWTSFGTPFFVELKKDMKVRDLLDAVTWRMSRVYRAPDSNSKWWEDGDSITDGEEVEAPVVNGLEHGYEPMEVDDPPPPVVEKPEVWPFQISFLDEFGAEMMDSEKVSNKSDPDAAITFPEKEFGLAIDWHSLAFAKKLLDEHALGDCTLRTSLPLTGQKKGPIELRDCFNLFITKETLRGDNAWYCPRCKVHREATKKIDIWTLPDILIVQLKRFSYTRFSRDKIEVPVVYPTRGLDLREFIISPDHPDPVYDLIGVSNHYGGLGGGHYTAYCRNKSNGHWYHFDDSCVTRTPESDVVGKAGYVLFYQRRGSKIAVRYPSISSEDPEQDYRIKAW